MYIKGPRGTFRVSEESESDLKKKGYGYHHDFEKDGVTYKVMSDGNKAVAIVSKKVNEAIDNKNLLANQQKLEEPKNTTETQTPTFADAVRQMRKTAKVKEETVKVEDEPKHNEKPNRPKMVSGAKKMHLDESLFENVIEAKTGKTKEVKVLQGNYGYGWDDLVEYDISDFNNNYLDMTKEIRRDLTNYRNNEKGVSHRVITRRVARELKESALNEGAGAGYIAKGTLSNIKLNSINGIDKFTSKNGFGIEMEFANLSVDADALFTGSVSGYYDGASVEDAQVKITKISINPNIIYDLGLEEFEYDKIELGDLQDRLSGEIKFESNVIGGGWFHKPFDGNVESDKVDDDYKPFIDGINFHFINKEDIDYIDAGLKGELEDDKYVDESLKINESAKSFFERIR